MDCESVILAAGLGTRMRSKLPKVLHNLGGRPMLSWSVRGCREAVGRPPYVIIGPEAGDVRQAVEGDVRWVEQAERLGTGHAVLQAAPLLRGRCRLVLVISADMPLLRVETLQRLVAAQAQAPGPITLLSARGEASRGFGRVVRDSGGRVQEVVEEAVASADQLGIHEYNTSVYCFTADWLWDNLPRLPLSAKGEHFLTDLVGMAAAQGREVHSLQVDDPDEVIGVNTRAHLAEAESALRRRINLEWMLAGVTLLDPATTYIGPDVRIGPDTLILPNTHLEGRTAIGRDCKLGPNTVIRDSTVGDACEIEASVVEEAVLDSHVDVGPFSHLRPGARLMQGVHVGNFAEIKNSTLGPGTKMGHFSYAGDATFGEEVNIGAGTITCNFGRDGKKRRTEVGDRAFIGSDTMLVAPVRIGEGAVTGAGSVVTKDVPDGRVAVGVPARVIGRVDQDDG
ncbi:MAG: bifunctional UDP-N-acetylglucosamine diphosphorylase/glucosamine-1-phosphate N-acetyltransferase GlmU [Chloroflexota bacterium]